MFKLFCLLAVIGGVGCSPSVARQPRLDVRHGYERVEDVRLFVREAGPEHAPAVVLLHGFPSASHMFVDLIPRLAGRFHVICPDYPGFGNSDRPDPNAFAYTFEHLSQIVERLLAQRGIDRYVLFMHDYGGPIGFRLAARHPDQIRALVVQNANAYAEGLSDAFYELKRPLWAHRSPETEEPIARFLREGAWRVQYTTGTRHPDRTNPDSANLDAWGLAQPNAIPIQLALQADYRDNIDHYPEWQAYLRAHHPPLLVVWGKHDPVFKTAGALAFRRDVPDAEIHLLDAGHFPLQEEADTTARLVSAFLVDRLGPDA